LKVAIYAIALNEEKFVHRWYESAKEADYLLIADTGSTDNTARLAQRLGINVVSVNVVPWRFDVARNTALSLLPKDIDYCIALDLDEVILPGWRKELESVYQTRATRPRYQYTWSWINEEEKIPGLQYGGDKIHTRSNYRWKHPVHEVLVPDRIEEVQEWTRIQIHHYPDTSKPRSQYLPLLELAVQEDPWDDRNAHYYARELFFSGQFFEAEKQFKRHLALPTSTWKPERAASMRYIAKCNVGAMKEMWLLKAVSETPERREPLVDLATFYYEAENWEKCFRFAEEAIKIRNKPLEYLCEEDAWGHKPYDLAAISAYNSNRRDVAVKYGEMALKKSPENKRLLTNLIFYKNNS
jgi:glycosyltransferase involved in cell wall biosynthesis